MTVEELIAVLQTLPGHILVTYDHYDNELVRDVSVDFREWHDDVTDEDKFTEVCVLS